MTDRRAKTSRANLGEHIPEALAPEGTEVVAVRLPRPLVEAIDGICQAQNIPIRSVWIRAALEFAVEETIKAGNGGGQS